MFWLHDASESGQEGALGGPFTPLLHGSLQHRGVKWCGNMVRPRRSGPASDVSMSMMDLHMGSYVLLGMTIGRSRWDE